MRFPTMLAALVLVATVLAGCAGGDGDGNNGTPSEADCAAQGLVLGEVDGAPACVEPGPVAEAHVEGLPATAPAYSRVSFEWVLETRLGDAHVMDTQVRVSLEEGSADALEGPDSYGERVERRQHQDFTNRTAYDAEFRFGAPGTYWFRAYAEVRGEHIWSAAVAVQAEPVQPTGLETAVTIQLGGPLPVGGLDPQDASLSLGDAVVFVNEDILEYTVAWEQVPQGAALEAVAVPAQGSADPVVLTVPGLYRFTAGNEAASHSGTLNVALPA